MTQSWLKVINELVVEKGEKKGDYYRATITSKEILQRLDAVITLPNHRNVRRLVEMHYPQTKQEANGPNAQNGWTFRFKIRSK